eukprot:gene21671-35325_t
MLMAANANPALVVSNHQRNALLEFSRKHSIFSILFALNANDPRLLWLHKISDGEASSTLVASVVPNANKGTFLVQFIEHNNTPKLTLCALVWGHNIRWLVRQATGLYVHYVVTDDDGKIVARGVQFDTVIEASRLELEARFKVRVLPVLNGHVGSSPHGHGNVLSLASNEQLHLILSRVLPSTESDSPATKVCQYLQQILTASQDSTVVRGLAPNTRFLFALRNDLIDGTLERKFNKELATLFGIVALAGRRWRFDKTAFARIYSQVLVQMDQLTAHQHDALSQCKGSQRSHIQGPAGCGKTYIALHMVIEHLESSGKASVCSAPILFVARNQGLCIFFINWIVQRLLKDKKKHGSYKTIMGLVSRSIRVLHSSPFADTVYTPEFRSSGSQLELIEHSGARDQNYTFVVVDEAHHIFATAAHDGDRDRVQLLCSAASNTLLLSDISQSLSETGVEFPGGYTPVLLTEIVRNSSRIVSACMPFSRAAELADVKSHHGVRGPPLVPFIFDSCNGDSQLLFARYAECILLSIAGIFRDFPGVDLHNHFAILVPNVEFRSALQKVLEDAAATNTSAAPFDFVDAVDGAFCPPKEARGDKARVVLDTLESFDGMERMFILAVGLDSVVTGGGCSAIYRALTRAHMFVGVVQERIEGGWLEFVANVKLEDSGEFSEKDEAARVAQRSTDITEVVAIDFDLDDQGSSEDDGVSDRKNDLASVDSSLAGSNALEDKAKMKRKRGAARIKRKLKGVGAGAGAGAGASKLVAKQATEVAQNMWQSNQSSLTKPVAELVFNPLQAMLLSGTSLTAADFTYTKVLGRGSFGKVMLAEMAGCDDVFAIKILKKTSVVEDDDVAGTFTEKRVLELSNGSPFLSKLHATFQTDAHLYFVMEFVNGGDLMYHIQNQRIFPPKQSQFYAAQILLALWYLHENGVIRRSVTLDDTMLDQHGHIKLVDFGMCKENMFGGAKTTTFCGTPGYLPPEIIKEKPYGASVDFWSLGVLCYEFLVGDSPFEADKDDELFDQICNAPLEWPAKLDPSAKDFVNRLLDRNPATRIGCGPTGKADIQQHAFFSGMDWGKMAKRQIPPPFKPDIKNPKKAECFDE